jgi:sulfhydrogenase subunit alpha
MKTVKINHIGKTEGHLSFIGAMVDGDFAQARIETEEGARLIEGILLGRRYNEAPVITSRICGICPIVHNLTSIKAMEQALDVKPTEEILVLRKMLINAQFIHSHGLHAFFLSFPDLVGISNNFAFLKKYPQESKLALDVRDWGVELARIVGGRTVHPINSVIGGFNVEPDFQELDDLIARSDEVINKTEKLFNFIIKQKLPKFQRPTNYVSLVNKKEYAIYDGEAYFFDNQETVTAKDLLYDLREVIIPHEKVKRVKHNTRNIMVGAISRINNSVDQLNPRAKKALQKLKLEMPCFNSFYNLFFQVVEMIHNIEEVQKLYKPYVKLRKYNGFEKRLFVKFKPNAGKGFAVMEAPRGVLYHEYELNAKGNIIHANMIPPTTIFLANLEKDLEEYLPKLKNMSEAKRELAIKTLIRAYDPCISCATH